MSPWVFLIISQTGFTFDLPKCKTIFTTMQPMSEKPCDTRAVAKRKLTITETAVAFSDAAIWLWVYFKARLAGV